MNPTTKSPLAVRHDALRNAARKWIESNPIHASRKNSTIRLHFGIRSIVCRGYLMAGYYLEAAGQIEIAAKSEGGAA